MLHSCTDLPTYAKISSKVDNRITALSSMVHAFNVLGHRMVYPIPLFYEYLCRILLVFLFN